MCKDSLNCTEDEIVDELYGQRVTEDYISKDSDTMDIDIEALRKMEKRGKGIGTRNATCEPWDVGIVGQEVPDSPARVKSVGGD